MKQYRGVLYGWHTARLSFSKEFLKEHYNVDAEPMIVIGRVRNDPTGEWKDGSQIRTSLVVNIDRTKGKLETMNSIYDLSKIET